MNKNPILSIVTTNKNDEYHENQLQRTKFILNYLIYSLKKMDAENKIEYLVVDWGSDEPLSNYFYKEISECPAIKFINVPKEETKKCELNYDYSKAINIGIDKSSGDNIMLTGSDAFFPLSIFNNIISLLEKPELFGLTGDEYKLVPRKFLEDDFFIYEKNMKKVDLYFQSLNHSLIPHPYIALNGGGGAGGNLLKKKQWVQIGGVKDTKKHNRGQDIVNLHETTKFCSHIDTATFGSFLLKLPRTSSGFRKTQVIREKNELDYLTFEKNENLINSNNIDLISNLNPPKKNLDFKTKKPLETKEKISIKETLKTIIDCISLTQFSNISLKSQDIKFILSMKRIIKTGKLKNIILDESQATRFILYLARSLPDLKFIIFADPTKNNPMNILKLRTMLTSSINRKVHNYYGHVKVVSFEKEVLKYLNKNQDVCIMQDFSMDNLSDLKKEFSSIKVSTYRTLISNTKSVKYKIESEFDLIHDSSRILRSETLINFLIYTLKTLRKLKRAFIFEKNK